MLQMRPLTYLKCSTSYIPLSMNDEIVVQESTPAFFTVLIGLPLAVWGGYTLIRDLIENQEAPFRRRPRPKPPTASDEPLVSDEQEDKIVYEDLTTDTDKANGEGVQADGESEDSEIPIHPEILYAQSIVLSDPMPGADQGPKNAFVIEATPVGLVAMGYDFEANRWIYWANQTPHFRVLDAVARIYVNTHNRHDLYIPPAIADAANEAVENQEGKENVGSGEGAKRVTPDKIAEDNKASLFITPTPVGAGEIPRPKAQHVANCFKRKGMLSELTFIPEGPREGPKRTSYADFLAKTTQNAHV